MTNTCPVCNGTGLMARVSDCGTQRETVTCPLCVRHIKVLGTHERLRAVKPNHFINPTEIHERAWKIWQPGEPMPAWAAKVAQGVAPKSPNAATITLNHPSNGG